VLDVPDRKQGNHAGETMISRRNIKLVLGFDGTAYHGWQIQADQKTIQGELQKAVHQITGEPTIPAGSGRTDAGTHARSFVANFNTSVRIPAPSLARALNSVLPPDIRILTAREVAADFHARRSARSKVYRYQIYRGAILPPHLAREHFHFPYPIDVAMMRQGADLLVGTHDFTSFAAKGSERANAVRHVYSCMLKRSGHRLTITVEGNGFLHHMVRNMAGTLLELGRGRMTPVEFGTLFELRDRTRAGFTAPAHGLILLRVRY
jgi:tRNA pseudouridine38-40 synthase